MKHVGAGGMGTVCVHRKAMSDRNQGYRLSEMVEANQGYEGGEEHGAGRRGRGKPCVQTERSSNDVYSQNF